MDDLEDVKIENGYVVGYVRTSVHGSKCDFYIATVEDWKAMKPDEREDAITNALFDSGEIEYGLDT